MAAKMVQSSDPTCWTILALTHMRSITTNMATPTRDPQMARISGPLFTSGGISAASAMLAGGVLLAAQQGNRCRRLRKVRETTRE